MDKTITTTTTSGINLKVASYHTMNGHSNNNNNNNNNVNKEDSNAIIMRTDPELPAAAAADNNNNNNNKNKVTIPPLRPRSQAHQQEDDLYSCRLFAKSLAPAETRSVAILRLAVICTLVLTAIVVSAGAYTYTRNEERENFTTNFEDSAAQVIESFHEMVERNLGAVASLSTDVTSYALQQQQQVGGKGFPFVTLPDFAERGSHARALSGSHVIHWAPLVTDETREEWEQYALENRDQIDIAYQKDVDYRAQQDADIGSKQQQQQQQPALRRALAAEDESAAPRNFTVLDDGTNFHPKIWSTGAITPKGDEPPGAAPYLPAWQRSPISPARQDFLNLNWARAEVIGGPAVVEIMEREQRSQLRAATFPIPEMIAVLEGNLKISQYREHVKDYIDGLCTFLVYPVFDSFGATKKLAGTLLTNVYWKILLSNLLPSNSRGIICVIKNSFNQTFTYRIDGSTATFIGMDDLHDAKYNHMAHFENINEYLQRRASPQNRAYSTVPFSDTTQYTINVYPSQDTEDMFVTNKPIIYTIVVLVGFAFASLLFLAFSFVVECRQHFMIAKVVENAQAIANTERELNEFLSHEVRNPLSAALSACSFVTSALHEAEPLKDPETVKCVREDIDVVNSSLNFINDFLRSMLDIHRANGNNIKIKKAPTDLLQDILEPVSAILHKRVANFEVIVDCPENLIVLTDCLRLKQVILNLVRNSSKFVERGFIRIRADVVDHLVQIYVEDSGPGITPDKQGEIFSKYQTSLDLLSQGTGLGLSLCKKLMDSMDGDVWLDGTYNSGIEGCPGACFVVQLNTAPLDMESTLPIESESENDSANSNNRASPGVCVPQTVATEPQNCEFTTNGSHHPPADPCSEPCPKPSAHVCALSGAPSGPDLPKDLSVLFVDDDVVLRKLFVRAVQKLEPSWKIQEASSGESALRLCQAEAFDVIFLDQYMASCNQQMLGTETAQALRSQGVKSIICGLSANDIRDSFISSGADNFLLKPMPCKPENLREALLAILKRQGEDDFLHFS